jgi:hypothetical protein
MRARPRFGALRPKSTTEAADKVSQFGSGTSNNHSYSPLLLLLSRT